MEQNMMDQNMMNMLMNNPGLLQNMMNMMNMMNMNENQIIPKTTQKEYYKIKHENPLNEKQLNRRQINLSLFFNGLTNFQKGIYIYKDKIVINYYNLEKIELYVNLDLNVEELISIIFCSIFSKKSIKNWSLFTIYKRTNSNQTTKWIIDNPIRYYKDTNLFSHPFFLEYKNKNLNDLSNKTGKEIGLKNGEEILLKLNKNFEEKLISLPLDGNYLNIKINGESFAFPTFDGEVTEEFKKRLFYFFRQEINYEVLPSNSVLRDKYINKRNNLSFINKLCFCKETLGGGVPIDFTDLSKGKTKELKFNNNAPEWRKVQEGLNIFGKCCNPECKAYKKEVVFMPKLIDQKFNLNDNITLINCPICNTIIKLKTCGFWKCEYQFIGQKIEAGRLIDFDSKPKETKNNEFEYYDPSENGNATWTKLLIYIIPKQKIKYKSH